MNFYKVTYNKSNNMYYLSIVYALFLMSDRELGNTIYTECNVSK